MYFCDRVFIRLVRRGERWFAARRAGMGGESLGVIDVMVRLEAGHPRLRKDPRRRRFKMGGVLHFGWAVSWNGDVMDLRVLYR